MLTYLVEDSTGNQATATRAVTVTEAADNSTSAGDQTDGGDDTGQDTESDDTAVDQAGGSDATDSDDQGGANDGSHTTGGTSGGDGTADVSSARGAFSDVDDRGGFLAKTGANGTLWLVVGGLLSVAAGVTVWQTSRRPSLIAEVEWLVGETTFGAYSQRYHRRHGRDGNHNLVRHLRKRDSRSLGETVEDPSARVL